MHAGMLAALEESRIPIAGLATVSGGSIIGGFYVAGGDPVAFKDAVAEGRFNLKREVIDFQNLPRLPCPGHVPFLEIDLLWFCSHSRIEAQAALLDRVLLNGREINDLLKAQEKEAAWWTKPPWWVIGATDLLRGEGIGISTQGVFGEPTQAPVEDYTRINSDVTRRAPSSMTCRRCEAWITTAAFQSSWQSRAHSQECLDRRSFSLSTGSDSRWSTEASPTILDTHFSPPRLRNPHGARSR